MKCTIIESLSYPVVLRDIVKESDMMAKYFHRIARFETSWRFINLILVFDYLSRYSILVSIMMGFNKVMSPLAKWPFEGRFKLTIIDGVNTNNSLVYESPVVKLQHTPITEQGFYMREHHNKCEIVRIPIHLLEERFRTEKGNMEFTLQIQEAEYVGI